MAICAIIRVSGFHYKGIEDDTWQFYWQQAEGATAVMMASITAFRTLFVKPSDDPNATTRRSPVESFLHRIRSRFQSLARADPNEKSASAVPVADRRSFLKLPKIPSPTFTGMRTYIYRNNRSNMGTTATFNTLNSEDLDPLEADYHAALRQNGGGSSRATSHDDSKASSHKVSKGSLHDRDAFFV